MPKLAAVLAVLVSLALSSTAGAHAYLYGSPGAEQEQLQQWINTSRAPTPTIWVRLYEGNCNEGRPEGSPAERREEPGEEASTVQTCASFTSEDEAEPTARNEAVYIPHMDWHPQYEAWWWHLNLLNEFGHVYDEVIGDRDRHREAFSAIYGYDPKWWWPINAFAAINTEWEKWSMAFAFCGYGMTYAEADALIESREYSGFGFSPAPQEYARTCRLIGSLRG